MVERVEKVVFKVIQKMEFLMQELLVFYQVVNMKTLKLMVEVQVVQMVVQLEQHQVQYLLH